MDVVTLYEAARNAGLLTQVFFAGVTVHCAFRAPDETVLDGFALSRDYQIDYPAAWLTLAAGDTVEVAGNSYQVRDVRAKTGNLANLTTTDKSNLVAAINELKAAVVSSSEIDDANIAISSTYSSSKIVTLLDALKAEILGGADAAYDTLLEIQQLLQNGTTGLDALLAAVNNRVRFDAAQSLTVAEQLQVRSNIGAVAATDVGNTDTDFVAVFVGALV